MIFDHLPQLLQNLKKMLFKGGGGLGGSGPKTRWVMHLLDKIMVLQTVKQRIQPLRMGYAKRPQKVQNGGVCSDFSYIQACLALI